MTDGFSKFMAEMGEDVSDAQDAPAVDIAAIERAIATPSETPAPPFTVLHNDLEQLAALSRAQRDERPESPKTAPGASKLALGLLPVVFEVETCLGLHIGGIRPAHQRPRKGLDLTDRSCAT